MSVAIPFFDEERFLAEAVDSVRAQTERSWELLLVDDGSTDGSASMADDLARASNAQIRVLRHPGGANRGLVASRNLAIGEARGEFLCFLDADDAWEPGKLARQLEQFRLHPGAVMVCGPSHHRALGSDHPGPVVPVLDAAPRLLRRGQFARMRMRGHLTTPAPSDVMYRVDALRRAGGVPDGPGMCEDQRTYVALNLVGPVFVDDVPLTSYTVRDDSMFGVARDDPMEQVRHHQEFERWAVAFCSRRGIDGLSVVVALLDRRLRRGIGRRLQLVAGRVSQWWASRSR